LLFKHDFSAFLLPKMGSEMAWEARWEDPQSVGWLVQEHVRCGKANCGCARDRAARHGPYWYLYWRECAEDEETTRLRKRYVRREEVNTVRARIETTKAEERREREEIGAEMEWLRNLSAALREIRTRRRSRR